MSTRLLAATGNEHKLAELRRILGAFGAATAEVGAVGAAVEAGDGGRAVEAGDGGGAVEVVGFGDLDPSPETWSEPLSQLVESGRTFLENARLKALHASRHQPLPVVADDSGLVVDALGGSPGVLSARWGGPALTDRERYEIVLRDMAAVPDGRRTARYVASVVLARSGEVIAEAAGACEVTLLRAPRGDGGFGYDPIALVEPLGKTMAELTPAEKDAISHRARALAALRDLAPDLLAAP